MTITTIAVRWQDSCRARHKNLGRCSGLCVWDRTGGLCACDEQPQPPTYFPQERTNATGAAAREDGKLGNTIRIGELALLAGAAQPIHGASPPRAPIDTDCATECGHCEWRCDKATRATLRRAHQDKKALRPSPASHGRRTATSSRHMRILGRSVEIWDARGTALKQLSRAGAYIGHSIEFMHDGRTLVTPAADDSAAGDKTRADGLGCRSRRDRAECRGARNCLCAELALPDRADLHLRCRRTTRCLR